MRRDDGLYGCKDGSSYDSSQGKRWAALRSNATICDTMEHAEGEARSS
jgi:hypothetical protein